MTSPDDTGLVERLLTGQHQDDKPGHPESLGAPSLTDKQAAARIEALTAEVEELTAENARLLNAFDGLDEPPVGEGEA